MSTDEDNEEDEKILKKNHHNGTQTTVRPHFNKKNTFGMAWH